jgi:YNFM family putative membrane transporter
MFKSNIKPRTLWQGLALAGIIAGSASAASSAFVARFGTRPVIWSALAVAGVGLPLMLSSHLPEVLAGMVMVGVGTFFAQASATGFVGQTAAENRGVASGTYLACYFLGGLVGSAVLGQLFDRFGWTACVAGVAASLAMAALLTARLVLTPPSAASPA